jgi:hypothetical protein
MSLIFFSDKPLTEGFSEDIKDEERENVAPGPISDTVASEPMNPRSTKLGFESQSIKSFLATDHISKRVSRLYAIVDIIYKPQLLYSTYSQMYIHITEYNVGIIIVACI